VAVELPIRGGRGLQPLQSNGFTLDMSERCLGDLVPSDPARPMDELRRQYRRQGYLWLKGLLDPDEVLAFRRRYFEAMRPTGLVAPGTDAALGIYSGGGENGAQIGQVMLAVVRWAYYEAFCMSKPIVAFYEEFLGGAVYLHKRKLVRHTKPGDPHCTGAHYDLVYLRGGTDRLCTSWIPIGDTPVEMGGLMYLEGSDAFGRDLEAKYAAQAGELSAEERVKAYNKYMATGWLTKDLPTLATDAGGRWLVADYASGDMVVHSPYMIHASSMNTDAGGRLRLSTDIRYQNLQDQIDARWQNHWSFDDGL